MILSSLFFAATVWLNAAFSTNDETAVRQDFPVPGGVMGDAEGVSFDFFCDDFSAFNNFRVYFRSGEGWHMAFFAPTRERTWQRICVLKRDVANREFRTDGWRGVSTIRIAGMRGAGVDSRIGIRDIRLERRTARIVVLRPDHCVNLLKGAYDVGSYLKYTGTVCATLDALGNGYRQVSDLDVDGDSLADAKLVVLPYTPSLPDRVPEVLKRFVEDGGKLLACYQIPKELEPVLGVRQVDWYAPPKGVGISGFLRKGAGLAGQPEFSPQGSWISRRGEPIGKGEVIAEWAGRDGKSLGEPALIRTDAGIFMAHVWTGGVFGKPLELMGAIIGSLVPGTEKAVAAAKMKAAARETALNAELRAMRPKAGEFRAMWCHSPYGIGGGRDWEASIGFLKACGFTDILVNLCWGGVAYYKSNVLPVAADVSRRGDALDDCLAACRKHGVRMHVWKVCWNMSSHSPSEFKRRMADEGRIQVDMDGERRPSWLCASDPRNRQLEVDAMLELSAKGVDGIHFDYIRFPDGRTCFCEGCRRRFEEFAGEPVVGWPMSVRTDQRLAARWAEFRRSCVSDVVRRVAEAVHGKSDVRISAATYRDPSRDWKSVGQDWPEWCRRGWLDFVCPMDYTEWAPLQRGMIRSQKAAVGSAKLRPGIGLSTWSRDGEDLRRLIEQIRNVRESGLDGFVIFDFDERAANVLPRLREGPTADGVPRRL